MDSVGVWMVREGERRGGGRGEELPGYNFVLALECRDIETAINDIIRLRHSNVQESMGKCRRLAQLIKTRI